MYHRGKKTTHLCGIFFIFSAAEQVSLQYHNCFISLFIQNLDTLSKHTAQCIIEPTWLEYCLMTREHCVSHAYYAPDTAYIMKMCEAEDTLVTVWKHPESRCGMWLMIKRIFDFVHHPPPKSSSRICVQKSCVSEPEVTMWFLNELQDAGHYVHWPFTQHKQTDCGHEEDWLHQWEIMSIVNADTAASSICPAFVNSVQVDWWHWCSSIAQSSVEFMTSFQL